MWSLENGKTVVVAILSKVRLLVPSNLSEFSLGETGNSLNLVESELSETGL